MVLVLPDWKERIVAAIRALPLPGVRWSRLRTIPVSPSYLIHWPRLTLVATIDAIGLSVGYWLECVRSVLGEAEVTRLKFMVSLVSDCLAVGGSEKEPRDYYAAHRSVMERVGGCGCLQAQLLLVPCR